VVAADLAESLRKALVDVRSPRQGCCDRPYAIAYVFRYRRGPARATRSAQFWNGHLIAVASWSDASATLVGFPDGRVLVVAPDPRADTLRTKLAGVAALVSPEVWRWLGSVPVCR